MPPLFGFRYQDLGTFFAIQHIFVSPVDFEAPFYILHEGYTMLFRNVHIVKNEILVNSYVRGVWCKLIFLRLEP